MGELLAMLECGIETEDLQAIAHTRETIGYGQGELHTKLVYFTLDTTFGHYREFHEGEHKYSLLFEWFAEQLNEDSRQGDRTVELYP